MRAPLNATRASSFGSTPRSRLRPWRSPALTTTSSASRRLTPAGQESVQSGAPARIGRIQLGAPTDSVRGPVPGAPYPTGAGRVRCPDPHRSLAASPMRAAPVPAAQGAGTGGGGEDLSRPGPPGPARAAPQPAAHGARRDVLALAGRLPGPLPRAVSRGSETASSIMHPINLILLEKGI
jgi:hypothetical protein